MARQDVQDLEDATGQAYYHADHICGSNYDGIATTIQSLVNAANLRDAINQVTRCLHERVDVGRRYGGIDRRHQHSINILYNFLLKLQTFQFNFDTTYFSKYENAIVRWNPGIQEITILTGYDYGHSVPALGFNAINAYGGGKNKTTKRKNKKSKRTKRRYTRKYK